MELARLSPLFGFKASNLAATGEFSGYASTFGGQPDSYGDTIAHGAFRDSLSEHKAQGTQPALLWSHDPGEPIGRWIEMREDSQGLYVRGQLTLEVERAKAAYALMHAGALALSIGFQTVAADYSTDGARLLKAVKLFEVSTVAMPANPSARITQVKATNIREFETKLRDIGFSVREARKLATGGWSALTRIDDSQELTQAAHEISSMAKLFGG